MSGTRIAILGGEGSGVIVARAIAEMATVPAPVCHGFLNDVVAPGQRIGDIAVIGPFEAWRDLPSDVMFMTAIHKAGEMKWRSGMIDALQIPEARFATLIHPTACLAEDVHIGAGTYVGPHATVMPGARIGRHVSLRAGCYVSHDVDVEDWCFIGPNAVVCGRARLRYAAHVGPGASVREELTLGRFSVAGLGAAVFRDVPDGTSVVGNPARRIAGNSGPS